MNATPKTLKTAIPGFSIPAGARAVMVTDEFDGTFSVKPVEHGKSVLNVQTELFDHLNAFPVSDEFLLELMNYCASRLEARTEATRTGGTAIARKQGLWEIAHVQMFQPVKS